MDYLSVFNDKFQELVKDLSVVFPDDPDFVLFKTSLSLILLNDKGAVQRMFSGYIGPYEENILNKNESFFLENKYDEFSSFQGAQYIIEKLKHSWHFLSTDNKDTVWKYLQVLMMLNKKIST